MFTGTSAIPHIGPQLPVEGELQAVDAGVVLPTINDGFAGERRTSGALELTGSQAGMAVAGLLRCVRSCLAGFGVKAINGSFPGTEIDTSIGQKPKDRFRIPITLRFRARDNFSPCP
jgi:hypothetical protein